VGLKVRPLATSPAGNDPKSMALSLPGSMTPVLIEGASLCEKTRAMYPEETDIPSFA
jgi:hypothetical protein